jgi:hypothetical protein
MIRVRRRQVIGKANDPRDSRHRPEWRISVQKSVPSFEPPDRRYLRETSMIPTLANIRETPPATRRAPPYWPTAKPCGTDHRFGYKQVKAFRRSGDPVISVDTKKKELVGAFKNAGRRWLRKGKADEVNVHDFPQLGHGKAIPYGAYDIARNRAVVNVGVTHETAEFAVESIRRWWRLDGKRHYRGAARLLICADSGGSNGNRQRAWKLHLQALSDETGMAITVCHYPPGTSKWNQIEHRLFSFISLNWKGKPLVNFETVVNLIGGTRTRTGLKVKAVLDTNEYETGVEISDEDIHQLRLKRHKVHPNWNYTLTPRS